MIQSHGIRKFASALLQANYYDDWGIKQESKIKVASKKVGKTKFYRDSVKYVYALEAQLEELTREIEAIDRKEYLSQDDSKTMSDLQIKKQRLETKLHKNIQYETDEQLMERANGWFDKLE